MERGLRMILCACALLVATAVATVPAMAIAAVPRQLVVTGRGATATVQTSPFRLQISASRNAGLSEVANTRPGPTPMPPTADPIAPGTDAQISHQLYAPLSYLVGTETLDQ